MLEKALNGREVEEGGAVLLPVLVVLAQPATSAPPGQGTFHDPASRLNLEPDSIRMDLLMIVITHFILDPVLEASDTIFKKSTHATLLFRKNMYSPVPK